MQRNSPQALLFDDELIRSGDDSGGAALTVNAIWKSGSLKASQDILPTQSSEGDFGIWSGVRKWLTSGRLLAVDFGMQPGLVHMHQRELVLPQAPYIIKTFQQLLYAT